jgi:hypothetical protein
MVTYTEEDHVNTMWAGVFQSSDWKEVSNLVLAVALLLSLMVLRPRPGSRPRVPPVLSELAATRPGEMVSVIVHEAMADTSAEELVARLGGRVTQDLHIINAFAAELPAQAVLELTKAEGVRWVTLNAPATGAGHPDP